MVKIAGAEKIIERFAYFPTFHDAEVLRIVLERDDLSASLRLLVPEFKDKTQVCSVEVELRFLDVEKLELENFNYQNVIGSLTFREVVEKTEYSSEEVPRIYVDLDPVFGVWSTFSCSGVEVTDVSTSARQTGAPPYNR